MAGAEALRRWKENPVAFVWENFQIDPDPWQKEALGVFPSQDPDKKRISMQACAGPGKTTCLAWMAWNFLTCYAEKGEHPKGAATSITHENLKVNLWSELSKWQHRSEFLKRAFTWNNDRIFATDHPETWFLQARSWSKSADAEAQGRTLSGLHAKYVLILIDESGDTPPSLLRTAEQAMSAEGWGKIVQAGNPTSLSGSLYLAATKLRHQWYVIRITADPDDPRRTPRVPIEHAREQLKNYGRDNPWCMATILGLFPPASLNALLGIEEVEAAMARHLTADQYEDQQKRLGVDVARFGGDESIIYPRQGLRAFSCVSMRNARSTEIAARVAAAKAKWGSEMEFIDCTGGHGSGVVDSLFTAGLTPIEVNFSGNAIDKRRFYNKRTEIHWLLAEWIKRGGALPQDPMLAAELVAPTYTFRDGRIWLQEKDQIKKALGRSNDRSDALALTFSLPDMPSEAFEGGFEGGKMLADYNPFE